MQGSGRATRNDRDYLAVRVLGTDLTSCANRHDAQNATRPRCGTARPDQRPRRRAPFLEHGVRRGHCASLRVTVLKTTLRCRCFLGVASRHARHSPSAASVGCACRGRVRGRCAARERSAARCWQPPTAGRAAHDWRRRRCPARHQDGSPRRATLLPGADQLRLVPIYFNSTIRIRSSPRLTISPACTAGSM